MHIRLHDEGGWWIEEIVKGDTANKVLEYMEYDVAELYPALARDCERAIRDGRMTIAESQLLKRFYERELNGYAYLEPAGAAWAPPRETAVSSGPRAPPAQGVHSLTANAAARLGPPRAAVACPSDAAGRARPTRRRRQTSATAEICRRCKTR